MIKAFIRLLERFEHARTVAEILRFLGLFNPVRALMSSATGVIAAHSAERLPLWAVLLIVIFAFAGMSTLVAAVLRVYRESLLLRSPETGAAPHSPKPVKINPFSFAAIGAAIVSGFLFGMPHDQVPMATVFIPPAPARAVPSTTASQLMFVDVFLTEEARWPTTKIESKNVYDLDNALFKALVDIKNKGEVRSAFIRPEQDSTIVNVIIRNTGDRALHNPHIQLVSNAHIEGRTDCLKEFSSNQLNCDIRILPSFSEIGQEIYLSVAVDTSKQINTIGFIISVQADDVRPELRAGVIRYEKKVFPP